MTKPSLRLFLPLLLILSLGGIVHAAAAGKTASISEQTPEPIRFIVRGKALIDLTRPAKPLFLRGMGYSPYLSGETPVLRTPPGNDGRYPAHLALIKDLGANYLHVFPRFMPPNFFTALDKTDFIYSQDVWVWAYEEDFLAPAFQEKTLQDIKDVIDHTYKVGRPDRLVLFSIGDELQPKCVTATDARHPEVHAFHGKHLTVTGRTPTEVAIAKLMDEAMEYELTRYGRRHLYCHTSFTHIGPIANRPDLEVSQESVLVPDMGDLVCLNIYTYANGVRTSPPGSVTGTTYQGYLEQLAAEMHKPILVTQVGLSTSPIAPKPWVPGFGGHKVEDVPKTLQSVWQDIRTARVREMFCGLVFFELQDEWWKSAKSAEGSTRHDPEDPEQWFGIYEVGKDNTLIPKGTIPATVKRLFSEP